MKVNHLHGLIAAPFTPMHKDGSLNCDLIADYYRFLKANKVNGAFICGSTGEGVSMSLSEKKVVAEAWAACTKDDSSFTVMTLLGGTWLYMHRKSAWMQFHLLHHFILSQLMQKCLPNAVQKLQQLFRICLSIIIISPY